MNTDQSPEISLRPLVSDTNRHFVARKRIHWRFENKHISTSIGQGWQRCRNKLSVLVIFFNTLSLSLSLSLTLSHSLSLSFTHSLTRHWRMAHTDAHQFSLSLFLSLVPFSFSIHSFYHSFNFSLFLHLLFSCR